MLGVCGGGEACLFSLLRLCSCSLLKLQASPLPSPCRLDWRNLILPWLRHRQTGLQAKGQNFVLEDSPFWIFGGSVHYFRVPKEYWRDRLLKMKACGLNTLTT